MVIALSRTLSHLESNMLQYLYTWMKPTNRYIWNLHFYYFWGFSKHKISYFKFWSTIFFLGQVSSALYCLRQRNTYQGNILLAWSRPDASFADFGGELYFNHSASQTSDSVSHVNEIIDSSKTKAQAMVDAAVQVHLESSFPLLM